jgi:rare lipoprotein A
MITRSGWCLVLVLLVLVLAGCATGRHGPDGPPADTDIDLAAIPDAVPEDGPPSRHGDPDRYAAHGKNYQVLKNANGFSQTGLASWYGRQFNGARTASGEPYDMYAMTAAHKTLPIPTWVRVTNLANHKQVVVKINDRGPFNSDRIIDLSYAAARKLGIVAHGTARVRIQTVTPATAGRDDASSSTGHEHPSTAARPTGNAASTKANKRPSGTLLQIGAFASAAHADHARRRARRSGVQQVVVIPPSAGTQLYRVRAGPFDSPAALAAAQKRLGKAGLPSYKVNK